MTRKGEKQKYRKGGRWGEGKKRKKEWNKLEKKWRFDSQLKPKLVVGGNEEN